MNKPKIYILTYGFVKKAPEDSPIGKSIFYLGVTVGLIEYFKFEHWFARLEQPPRQLPSEKRLSSDEEL
jgi:hypothetical protein